MSEVALPQNDGPVPDFKRCGGGKGEACCTFLTLGADGFCCERNGPLHQTLVERTQRPDWSSKRMPTEPWPHCQLVET